MPDIWAFMRAVRNSNLPHPAKHVLLTLASLADSQTAVIPEKYTPSLTELSRMTSLGRSTVADALRRVDVEQVDASEVGGWVKRLQPSMADARIHKAKTQYALLVPGPGDGLVQDMDQPDQLNPDTRASPGDELVQEPDGASPGDGHEVPTGATEEKNPPSGGSARPRKRRKGSTEEPTRIPDDFGLTQEMIDWGRKRAPLVNGAAETEIFIRYWRNKTRDNKKLNWTMAWEQWILKEQKRLQEIRDRDQQRAKERMAGGNGGGYGGRPEPPSPTRTIPRDRQCPNPAHRGKPVDQDRNCRQCAIDAQVEKSERTGA